MPVGVGTAELLGEAVHSAKFPRRRICVGSDTQEPCSKRLHLIDVNYAERLPALGMARRALARPLVHEDDLDPRTRRSVSVGLNDSRASLVAEPEDRPTPDRLAEAVISHCRSRPPAPPHGALNDVRGMPRRLVLPDPDDTPPCGSERVINRAIAFDVACELGLPVLDVHLRGSAVLRTSVPEAPVDEHSHPSSREDNVCAHPTVERLNGVVNAEAKAPAVQFAPERKLRLGVPAGAAPHRR